MSSDVTSTGRGGAEDADELTRALLPTVEKAIRISVRRDSRPLVDAIFPVMGPAIRKSIAEALRSMVQSLSRTLENSLSIRGLRWRFEAWRSGRPFAEVVLLHSLVYRVEQVFLIHRGTGLLLQHVQPGVAEPQDADMVSAMLTAIRDFVRDSFSPDGGGALETIRMGDVNVWVEDGPLAILAAVVRGTAPEGLREVFAGAQEAVHSGFQESLAAFDGDTGVFEGARPILEGCLGEQQNPVRQRTNPLLFVIPALVLAGAGLLVWLGVSRDMAWDALVHDLRFRPGVMIVESRRVGNGGYLRGARDPAGGGFDDVIAAAGLDVAAVRQEWIPIQSDFRPYELNRIVRALLPPAGVDVSLSEDRVLTVSGRAGHRWIDRVRTIAATFPRVARVDFSGMVDVDRVEAERLAGVLRATVHAFEVGSSELPAAEVSGIRQAAYDILALRSAARRADMAVAIEVVGRADPTGADSKNRVLSIDRAVRTAELLAASGVPRRILWTDGLGTVPLNAAQAPHNRCVTYEINLEPDCDD